MIGKLASLRKLTLGKNDHIMELEPDEINDPLLYSLKECPLTELNLYQCNISARVVSLAWLKDLTLHDTKFSSHPDSLLQLHGLNTITFLVCNNIHSIPNLPGNITSITAQNCRSLVNLPCNISMLKSLRFLYIEYCHKLGTEDPHFLMKVTGLMNLSHLSMKGCNVSQVPSEIGNLVSLKELDLSDNTFSSLPDSLSNLLQLVFFNIERGEQLQLLPLLPSDLTTIHACRCLSLDVRSSASIRIKVSKESPFSRRFMIQLSQEMVPDWCSYQSSYFSSAIILEMYNKTKNISHRFVTNTSDLFAATTLGDCMYVLSYPLDDTTLLVEHGDSVVLKLPRGLVLSCGLRLIYESDVVDCILVFQTATEPIPHISSEMPVGITQSNAISNDTHGRDCSCSDDEDELWWNKYK
ncbi:hypothetical protein L1987_59521 [Smallanthus sonchifolius]|uniref:Uncharacterized protein n=1 Tax=Smallanthus sonchifolius TaxID=185202 RepID=A0ACB9D628_9ASTR|nr:hypothetical protein L1987_59521 [Smallanthus sonchifolius]